MRLSECNTLARLANRDVVDPEQTLVPLVSTSNTDIVGFPTKLRSLLGLTSKYY